MTGAKGPMVILKFQKIKYNILVTNLSKLF